MSEPGVEVEPVRDWPGATSLGPSLAGAFQDDPVWENVGPRARAHRTIANRLAFWGIVRGSHRHGARMRLARLAGSPEVLGGTIAFGPGGWPPPTSAFGWELPWAFLAGPLPIHRGIAADNAMRENHIDYPHMYLWYIGVEPGSQGTGMGRALMAELHEEADRRDLPTYLETGTESNVGFYKSLGYTVLSTFDIPSGAKLWRMERPARAAAGGAQA